MTRDQLLHDLFVTALEGGIGYWSTCTKYHWMIGPHADDVERPSRDDLSGFYATIYEDDQLGGAPLTINRTTIANGLQLAAGAWSDRLAWSTEAPPVVVTANTDWDFDAGDADMIVQLGLFGDLIYG